MEDNDEWKLGDDGERPPCPRCGKVNRPGLTHCAICGTALADEIESGPEVLRTIGESMGRRRPPRGRRPEGGSPRAWIGAAGLLLLIVAVLTWLQSGERPFRLEDLRRAAQPTAIAPPTAVATRVTVTITPRPAPTPVPVVAPPPLPTAVPTVAPAPTLVPTAPPTVTPAPTARPAVAVRAKRTPRPRATRRPSVPTAIAAPEAVGEATPAPRPAVEATEKPSLGTDLQEATREYRHAVDVHNQRVDEYNGLADEIQRRRAFDDSPESVELRRRLDRAREAVEGARVDAEALKARMEAVRTRYR